MQIEYFIEVNIYILRAFCMWHPVAHHVVISFWEIDAATIFRRKAKAVAEDRVNNFDESLNGSGVQKIRLRPAFCCEFR